MADPAMERETDALATAWLRLPFEQVAQAKAMHGDMVQRNDINQYRVRLLLATLERANLRLSSNNCQPVVVPDLDRPAIEKLMVTHPF